MNRERKGRKAVSGESKPQLQGLMFLQSFGQTATIGKLCQVACQKSALSKVGNQRWAGSQS